MSARGRPLTIGVVNGLQMGPMLVMAGKLGYGGRTWYATRFDELDGDDAVREAIRTCLAGEVARTGAQSVEDFGDDVEHDVALARRLTERLNGNAGDIIAAELKVVVEEVELHTEKIDALADALLNAPEYENGHFGLASIAAAQSIGYLSVRSGGPLPPDRPGGFSVPLAGRYLEGPLKHPSLC
jgi:hypothetical protein